MPINLVCGSQVNRPLSDVNGTSPKDKVNLDWILCSKAMLPACGIEIATDKKPDHALSLVSQGYWEQKSLEEAQKTNALDVAVVYQQQKDLHAARWSAALLRKDVDELWNLCRASEQALGLQAETRGQIQLGHQQLLELQPEEEALATARQQDQVTDVRRKRLDTRPCTCFEWPTFVGEIPPTVEAQDQALETWITSRHKKERAGHSASWRAYVREMWELDDAAEAELTAWSKLWQPEKVEFPNKLTSQFGVLAI
eukprot:2389312-Amphidinium_carterae.4